ncbi:hypothetical protein FPOAC1_003246 [Fusarium poae]|uniref:hypothetical protein n=1 Tax=Fusarium poae TaxID=36050 RepID=UPI001CE94034|nr:hypothetical protein FPOAC1_003246 [Fusarium poae]KAG8677233.1 hypothetical protein FPOAC1_003246 [Fusarium poae]
MAGKFEPKTAVTLDPPKDDIISKEELAKANGTTSPPQDAQQGMGICATEGGKCYVAIKGKVYDVTGNKAYLPGASYNVFAGKDASRALAKSSTKQEDALPEWQDLDDKEKKVLNDWITFFSKRYNIVGVVEGATNME